MTGTYRRDGSGDYRCSKSVVQAMLRDAAVKSQDMQVLQELSLDVFEVEMKTDICTQQPQDS